MSRTSCWDGRAASSELLFALWMSDYAAVPALYRHLPKADPLPARRAGLGPDHLQDAQHRVKPDDCLLTCSIKDVIIPDQYSYTPHRPNTTEDIRDINHQTFCPESKIKAFSACSYRFRNKNMFLSSLLCLCFKLRQCLIAGEPNRGLI